MEYSLLSIDYLRCLVLPTGPSLSVISHQPRHSLQTVRTTDADDGDGAVGTQRHRAILSLKFVSNYSTQWPPPPIVDNQNMYARPRRHRMDSRTISVPSIARDCKKYVQYARVSQRIFHPLTSSGHRESFLNLTPIRAGFEGSRDRRGGACGNRAAVVRHVCSDEMTGGECGTQAHFAGENTGGDDSG